MNVLVMRSCLCSMVLAATVVSTTYARVSPDLPSGLTARSISTAGMGGRGLTRLEDGATNGIVALEMVESRRTVMGADLDVSPAAHVIPRLVLDPPSVPLRTEGG